MSTAGNTDNDRTGGGNNIKKNFTATTYGNDHGTISFGKVHKRGDVTSDVMLQASDGRHFVSLDNDGQRKVGLLQCVQVIYNLSVEVIILKQVIPV